MYHTHGLYKIVVILNIYKLIFCASLQPFECDIICPPNTICEGDNICTCIERLIPGGNPDVINRDPNFPKLPYCTEESSTVYNDNTDDDELEEEPFIEDNLNYEIDKNLSENKSNDVTQVQTHNNIEIEIVTKRDDQTIDQLDSYTPKSTSFYVILGIACIAVAFIMLILLIKRI